MRASLMSRQGARTQNLPDANGGVEAATFFRLQARDKAAACTSPGRGSLHSVTAQPAFVSSLLELPVVGKVIGAAAEPGLPEVVADSLCRPAIFRRAGGLRRLAAWGTQ